jgi:very-short-patch-repair endonuclease
MLSYNKRLKMHARKLRKNMTDVENLLWTKLRKKQLKGYQFYRQKIIGNYIVDFFCPRANVVIEVDGSQHYSEEGENRDKRRDNYLRGNGLKVLRFSDREVFENLDGVMESIWENL